MIIDDVVPARAAWSAVVAAGDVLRLVLTETGGGRSSVVVASGGSSPSRLDLPATVMRSG